MLGCFFGVSTLFTKDEILKTATQMLNGNQPPAKFYEMLEKTLTFRDRVAVLDFSVTEVAIMLSLCGCDAKKEPIKPKLKRSPPPKDTDWAKVEHGTEVLLASGSNARFVKLIDKENGIAEVVVDDSDSPDKIPIESLVLK
jgi:hypothetical protein